MWTQILFFGLGLVALYFGAEWLVRGAARFARAWGVSAVVVGLTVVAFGTSTPEMVVSTLAAASDRGDVGLGNILGSNVVNLALILGLASLIYPLRVQMRLLAREIPIMVASAMLLGALAVDGRFGRGDGLLLLTGFLAFVGFILHAARREPAAIQAEFTEFEEAEALEPTRAPRTREVALIVGGIVGLVVGANLLVESAVYVARSVGISEVVIGLTIVALGTSLPELATTLVASYRRETDIAFGNVIGSNIFNVLAILGLAAAVRPLRVAPGLLHFEIPVVAILSILLLPLAWTRLRIERWEGALLVSGYIVFTWIVLIRSAGAPA